MNAIIGTNVRIVSPLALVGAQMIRADILGAQFIRAEYEEECKSAYAERLDGLKDGLLQLGLTIESTGRDLRALLEALSLAWEPSPAYRAGGALLARSRQRRRGR